jgi:uncharacterized protein
MAMTRGRRLRALGAMIVLTLIGWSLFDAPGALAETRRALVLGVKNYTDRDIQTLQLPEADAKDVASDLEQVGFDKKNITTVLNLRAKADFDKQFNAFLATIKEGDIVFFYYSGHGIGLESNNTNYLLLGGVRSLFGFARDKLPAVDRRNDDIVRLKMSGLVSDYENDEIAKNGVSVQDVIAAIGKKKPRIAILMLDACRALVQSTVDDTETLRSATSGSRLLPATELPQGSIVIYSASFGESAIEKFFPRETRRNSLFTEVVRSEMQRPGQTLIDFGDRIRLMVRRYAAAGGKQQEPEYFHNLGSDDQFALVDSVGGERFDLKQQQCEGAKEDWDDINRHPQREAMERHQTRYHDCPTAELARRALVGLLASSQDPTPVIAAGKKQLDDCDRLAASDNDPARPPEVAGVPLAQIDYAAAVDACDTSIKRNTRVPRFLYNLGRAELANATYNEDLDDVRRAAKLKEARAAFSDAAERGYVSAIFSLATLFDDPDETPEDRARNDQLLTKAAQQQYAPAMYELAIRYRDGSYGTDQDINQGYQWMIKAAEAGYTKAMVGAANALFDGRGVGKNPRRAVEWAVRAANSGSVEAKLRLGWFYFNGRLVFDSQTNEKSPNSLERDYTQALLWFGRAAEENNSAAQYNLGFMMERGNGLPGPQPEIAEKYYRLAAHGGDEDAEFELARRLRAGVMLAKPENGDSEALDLLRRALSHGSARAAEALAEIYRNGELGVAKDPVKAIQYSFQAIRLSVLADPTLRDGDPFYEIEAGILIAEMASNNQAVDVNGHPLLKPDELDRLQKFYGKIDAAARRVKVRSFEVPLNCIDPKVYGSNMGWFVRRPLWVWDWGRQEAPTESQFRSLERETECSFNDVLRQTLVAAFEAARKNNVAFADLVEEEVNAARTREDAAAAARSKK